MTINYFAKLIARVLDVPDDLIKDNLRMRQPDISFNKDTVKSETDYVLENGERYFNIEFNNMLNEENMVKNNAYACQLYLRQLPNKKAYKNIKKVTQICINSYDLYKKGEFIYHSTVINKKYGIERPYTLIDFYDINLEFLYDLEYTKVKEGTELEKMLYLLTCNDSEFLKELYKGDVDMTELERQRQIVLDNIDSLLYYDRDDILPEEVRIAKSQARKEGLKEGRKEGREETTIEFVKNMLNIGISVKDISEVTKLSVEEIERIIKSK